MTFGYYLSAQTRATQPQQPMPSGSTEVNRGSRGNPQLAALLAALNRQNVPQGSGGGSPALADILSMLGGRASGAAPGGGGGPPGETPAAGGAGAGGGAGRGAGSTAAVRAGAGLAGVAVGSFAVSRGFNRLVDRTLALNSQLEEWSGTIAAANAEARAREMERRIQIGGRIGQGYTRLSEQREEFRDITTNIMAPLQNSALNIMSALGEIRNSLLQRIEPVAAMAATGWDLAIRWLTGAEEEPDIPNAARAFLSDVHDGKFDGFGTTYMNPSNTQLFPDAEREAIFGPAAQQRGRQRRPRPQRPRP